VTASLLDGIELVIFDKDGTLIEFEAMWGAWTRALADDLARATGRPMRGVIHDLLGVDPATGAILPHGLLAATPMARIRELVVASVSAQGVTADDAEAAVAGAWRAPDPVELATPVTDLPRLLGGLREAGRRIAIATSDDRDPTERTLDALGIAGLVDGIACADDGLPVKPSPAAVLQLCSDLGVPAVASAVVGDSPADLRMGRAAGAGRVIGVLSGVGDRAALEPLADAILPSVAELAPQ